MPRKQRNFSSVSTSDKIRPQCYTSPDLDGIDSGSDSVETDGNIRHAETASCQEGPTVTDTGTPGSVANGLSDGEPSAVAAGYNLRSRKKRPAALAVEQLEFDLCCVNRCPIEYNKSIVDLRFIF